MPTAVQDAFQAEFADTMDVEWEMKDNQYEAKYEMQDDTDYHVLYDASGTMISRKHEIEETKLPAEVMTAIKNDYPDYEVDDAEMLEKDGETYYQVELEKFLRDKEKVYSASGEPRDDVSYCGWPLSASPGMYQRPNPPVPEGNGIADRSAAVCRPAKRAYAVVFWQWFTHPWIRWLLEFR